MEDSKEKPILDEIAGVEKDIFTGYIGKVLLNPDKVLSSESKGKGIEIYEDLLRDPEIRQAMETRRLAVVGREWEVVPASEDDKDIEIADFIKEVLLDCNFDAGRKALLNAIVLGYKVVEIMWEYSEDRGQKTGGRIRIKKLIGRASKRFTFDLQGNLRLLTIKNMIEGEEVPNKKFLVFSYGSDNGSPFGHGLGSSLYWLDWFGKNSLKFWLIFADKFGSPTAVGKYPTGTTKEQQDVLLSTLEAIQQEFAIKIPNTMMIELLEAARQGSVNTYETLCTYLDKKKTKLILGQTLTSDVGDKGSYAASQTHEKVRQDYIKADADELSEILNGQIIKWLVDYNFSDVSKYPKFWIRTEDEKDLKPLAEKDKIIYDMGFEPEDESYINETYGGKWKRRAMSNEAGQPSRLSEFAEGKRFTPAQQAVEELVDKSLESGVQSLDLNEEKILEAIQKAESYEDAMGKILGLYPQMDMDRLTSILERSILAAGLYGKYNARNNT